MAQNPRDQSLQNGMFDNANDGYNYNNFYSHGQGYGANLTADPELTDAHSPYNAAAFQHNPAWQHPVASSSYAPTHQSPSAFANPAARNYYTSTPPNASTSFQNNPPYASHGLQHQHYSHSLDPSMVSSGGEHNRSYGQTMSMYSSAAPSNTISPAALHANTYMNGNRPVQTPPIQMPNQFQQAGTMPSMLQPPRAVTAGEFKMTPMQELLKATNSVKLGHYAAIGRTPVELPINKATIPQYVPRKSQNELLLMSGADPSLKAKIAKRTKKIHVPKYRPNVAGQSPASLSSDSDSSDYDSDSDYDSEPEPEKFPLQGARPQDAIGATRYDSAKAVFLPRNVYVENEALRLGLKHFWNLIKTIRERWNKDSEAVKEAAEAKKDSELPMLRDRVKNQRDMMKVSLDTAIEFGHPDLIRASGSAKPFMMTIKSFLLERNREDDHDSPFTKTLFKYLSLSTGLTIEIVEELGFNKIFTRFSKRGDAEIKALINKINENTMAESKKTKKEIEPATAGSPKPVKNETKVELVAGVKRPRPADGAAAVQPAKRVSSGPVVQNAKESTAARLGLSKRPGSVTGDKTSTVSTAVKPKVIAKPSTNFFSSLQSASKKPGTSLNGTSATKVKSNSNGTAERKTAVAPAAPMKSGFSFAETMANLAKAREPEVTKKPDDPKRPPETAEQKAKRLRKEERRKLRVTWKPEGTLVEIREFSRDPSEMNNNNARDVRDGKEKEGLMFKQHMEMMDADVDEEDDQPMEQTFFEFKEPSSIDFSRITKEDRERNYEPYGGGPLKPDSPERTVQENREATTLMAFYAFKSDIPPCPREPADPYTGEHVETKSFGEPDDGAILRRLARLQPPAPAAPSFDINAILQQLAPQTQQPPPPVADQNLSAIQHLLQQTNNTYQPAPAPMQTYATALQPPATEAQPPNPLFDILASLNGHVQSPAQPPAPQQYAPPPAAPPQIDLSTLLASLQQGQMNPQTLQAFGMPPVSNTPELYVDPERKRMLEQQGYEPERSGSLDYGSDGNRSNKRQKTKNNNNNGQGNPEKKFIYACKFFKEGKCKKGANCTFRHD
ncbi:hypothetical protein E6O75_ATG08166 [Venturia nashicola]|uniref:C3H1-type domain-containing protein n=1 Tax=Venturia nashicola TaxID=86259 RepID=A0A4Z1P137_9PEZI|nr:hypothetical protein E6O75_ATG08166 [Venturia nashicola]